MRTTRETGARTPAAEAALRRARDNFYRLSGDQQACAELFEWCALPIIAPEERPAALAEFRRNIANEQFRMEFLLFAHRSVLALYQEGAFDEVA